MTDDELVLNSLQSVRCFLMTESSWRQTSCCISVLLRECCRGQQTLVVTMRREIDFLTLPYILHSRWEYISPRTKTNSSLLTSLCSDNVLEFTLNFQLLLQWESVPFILEEGELTGLHNRENPLVIYTWHVFGFLVFPLTHSKQTFALICFR